MYWRLTSMPELQHLTPDQRRTLIRRCLGKWIMWQIIGNSIALGALFGTLPGAVIANASPLGDSFALTVSLTVSIFLACLAYWVRLVRIRGSMLTWLKRYGRDHPLPICLGCGYDLEGAASPTCPECGARIVPLRTPAT